MITQVILPKLGQTMEDGVIVDWVKKEGAPVARGDVLFTVESDKAVLEVEATARGYLRKILVPAGQTVPVLAVVAIITREADEDISEYQASGQDTPERDKEPTGPSSGGPTTSVDVATEPRTPELGTGRIFASPRARKAARERDVDLALVTGTGPNGRIVEKDVFEHVASRPKATPMAVKTAAAAGVDLATVSGTGVSGRIMRADVETAMLASFPSPVETTAAERVPMAGVRRIIAERMAASHRTTARVTLVTEADATELVKARESLKATVSEEWGFAPGYNDLLGLIVARALREFPYMNARLSENGEAIERLAAINLGVAVDTERGLLVPVIRDADQKGLRALGTEFRALMEQARVGRSQPDDLTGGTFTITNLGMYDIDAFTPIINLPEAAILGAGRIQPKAVVRDGEIVARQMWTLSLDFDHRLVDGAPAARFLQRIKLLIENPYLLLG
jgi:pyruvate dehydrogenase E2 component (dihydrolipoamide acetyltransferase)